MKSRRITLLANLSKDAKKVVDIGCDHGYTLLEIFKSNNELVSGYALDVNEGPLNQARNTFSKTSYFDKVKFCLSNGLLDFDDDFDTAIISGMGGSLISQILEDSKAKFKDKTLILEPQGNINLVRRWLYSNGYDIFEEYDLLENNKYYNFLVAKGSNKRPIYNILDINYGPILRKKRTKEFIDYYTKIYNNFNSIKNKPIEIKEKLIELDYILNNKEIIKTNGYTELLINDSNNYILIFPGGGYEFTTEREGNVVGLHFNACGYNALVFDYLDYKLNFKEMCIKVSSVINEYFKDKKKATIHLLGFSAGAHLVLELSNHNNIYTINAKDILLGYPLVSTKKDITHQTSFNYLMKDIDTDILRYSQEEEVNDSSLPMFIFTTSNDEVVNPKNTFLLCEAYSKVDISYECHVLGNGPHGLSLGTKESARTTSQINTTFSMWFNLALNWLKRKEN